MKKKIAFSAVILLSLVGAAFPPRPDLTVNLVSPATAFAGADIGPQVQLRVKNVGNAQIGRAHV